MGTPKDHLYEKPEYPEKNIIIHNIDEELFDSNLEERIKIPLRDINSPSLLNANQIQNCNS